MAGVTDVQAWEILDSRGNPTVRVSVRLSDGATGVASVPSGASTGSHEALELRDGDITRYGGKGVLKAVKHVNGLLAPVLAGKTDQRELDDAMRELDGTENKSKLGANAILGVSLAFAHAQARSLGIPLYRYMRQVSGSAEAKFTLPLPMMNIENGGKHADSGLSIQEFMIIPHAPKFRERLRKGAEVFHALQSLLRKKGYPALVGDEGGFAPHLKNNESALKMICASVKTTGFTLGKDIMLGIDFAASEFYDPKTKLYALNGNKRPLTTAQMIAVIEKWKNAYPLESVEDGLAEDDWEGWRELTKKLGKKLLLVGDDFFVTSTKRLKAGIDSKCANAILIKLNQIGTLSETLDCISLAQSHKYKIAVSHRSGETADTTIADLAVAVNAEYIKSGSLSRSERMEKYNRLLEIERELSS